MRSSKKMNTSNHKQSNAKIYVIQQCAYVHSGEEEEIHDKQ